MAFSPAARAWRDGGGDPAARLLLLRADPLDTLDRESGPATFLGDLAVLLHDEAARWLVALGPPRISLGTRRLERTESSS
jgi:hypothetical protein